jgi:hypothetical protein
MDEFMVALDLDQLVSLAADAGFDVTIALKALPDQGRVYGTTTLEIDE